MIMKMVIENGKVIANGKVLHKINRERFNEISYIHMDSHGWGVGDFKLTLLLKEDPAWNDLNKEQRIELFNTVKGIYYMFPTEIEDYSYFENT